MSSSSSTGASYHVLVTKIARKVTKLLRERGLLDDHSDLDAQQLLQVASALRAHALRHNLG